MSDERSTRLDATYDEWFMACWRWWDRYGFEEAQDYPWLPWREWYEAGLTAQQGARKAHEAVFGGPLCDG